nr:hypothetical protein [Angustibacter aerolatus]
MRDVAVTEGDKTEAEIRFGISTNTWAVNEPGGRGRRGGRRRRRRAGARVRDRLRRRAAPAPGRRAARVAPVRRAPGAWGCWPPGVVGRQGVHHHFEDLGGLRRLPGLAVQRLMARGYGFGAEGDWKTAALVRAAKVMGEGLPGGASLMEDYTYDLTPGDEPGAGRPHARGLPLAHDVDAAHRGAPAGHRRARGPGAHGVPGRPRPRRGRLAGRRARPVPAHRERRRPGRRARRACRTCRSRGRSGSRAPTSPPAPSRGCWPAARTTPCCRPPPGSTRSACWPASPASSLLTIEDGTTVDRFEREPAVEPGLLPAGRRAVSAADVVASGRAVLGVELGSTRIKGVLIGPDHVPLAAGSHEWENGSSTAAGRTPRRRLGGAARVHGRGAGRRAGPARRRACGRWPGSACRR